MAYCECVQRMTGLETQEPEEQDTPTVDDSGVVSAQFLIERQCSECSETKKSMTFDLEGNLEAEADVNLEFCSGNPQEMDMAGEKVSTELGPHDWVHSNTEASFTEGGGGRYKKNMIGVEATVTFTCSHCSATAFATLKDEEAASSFEDA